MPEQQRHPVDRDAFVQQFNCKSVTEHVSMATLWSFVGLADVGDFEQPSEGPAPSFAGGLRIAISRPEKVTRIAAGQCSQNRRNIRWDWNVNGNASLGTRGRFSRQRF